MRTVQRAPVTGVVLLVALPTLLQATVGLGAVGWTVGLLASATAAVLLAVALHRAGTTRFGPANVVTLVRVTLGQAVAALVAASIVGVDHQALLLALTASALALDAIDGHVARRTRSITPLGARFDMEADAFLILVLSVAAAPMVGWWVLAIGSPGTLCCSPSGSGRGYGCRSRRYWRKVVAAVQGVTLAVVVTGVSRPWKRSRSSWWPSGCWPSRSDATSRGWLAGRPCGPGTSRPHDVVSGPGDRPAGPDRRWLTPTPWSAERAHRARRPRGPAGAFDASSVLSARCSRSSSSGSP